MLAGRANRRTSVYWKAHAPYCCYQELQKILLQVQSLHRERGVKAAQTGWLTGKEAKRPVDRVGRTIPAVEKSGVPRAGGKKDTHGSIGDRRRRSLGTAKILDILARFNRFHE